MIEVKLKPIAIDDIPGMKAERPHDEWAKAAISKFVSTGEKAAEVEIPDFAVTKQTVRNLLAQYGNKHHVKVRTSAVDGKFRVFLVAGGK